MTFTIRVVVALCLCIVAGLFFTIQYPPVLTVQTGYRGTGMAQNFHPATIRTQLANNQIPAVIPRVDAGPPAGQVYKNVQVLGDLNVGAFTRLMASITTWVAPDQGCSYCHNVNNMASDALYTKVVARRMIQMVRHVNSDWKSHVGDVGVTCYTCHRGQPVPSLIWFTNPGQPHALGMVESYTGKNMPAVQAGLTSLPYDPLTPFLEGNDQIRVQSTTALPTGDRQSIKQTDWTYALMMNISQSLGVNCTYCHDTRSFSDWSQSSPQRAIAWYGIRMVRDLNNVYLGSLASVFPHSRLGPLGDVPKLDCATCHQGVYKPLFGQSILADFPELAAPNPPGQGALPAKP